MSIITYKTTLKIKLLKTNLKLHFILRQHDGTQRLQGLRLLFSQTIFSTFLELKVFSAGNSITVFSGKGRSTTMKHVRGFRILWSQCLKGTLNATKANKIRIRDAMGANCRLLPRYTDR